VQRISPRWQAPSASGSNAKRYRLAELALRNKIPLVMLLEGAGFRPGQDHARTPTDMLAQAQCSGRVPLVAAVLGPSAGPRRARRPSLRFHHHESPGGDLHRGPSGGERVDGARTFQKKTSVDPMSRLRAASIHNVGDDDEAVLEDIRRYLTYFPPSAWSYPPKLPAADAASPRSTPELLDIVPRDNRRIYDMRAVLDVIADSTDWFEVQAKFGKAIVCALAHLGGDPVAVVANQPRGASRFDRRRRRRQGSTFHFSRRLVSSADHLPRR